MSKNLDWLGDVGCNLGVVDAQGRVLACNHDFEQILGVAPDASTDRALAAVLRMGEQGRGLADEWLSIQEFSGGRYMVHYIPLDHVIQEMVGVILLTPADGLLREIGEIGETLLPKEVQSIFDQAYDGLFITDGNGRILMVNSSWEELSGFSRRDILGRRARDLVAEGKYSRSVAELVLKTGQTETILLEISTGKRAGQRILATGVPIFGFNGGISRVVANIRDVAVLNEIKTRLEERQFSISKERLAQIEQAAGPAHDTDGPAIIVKSAAMRRTMDMVARVAGTDATVLLAGETGVGKEVVARSLYSLSSRSKRPYIQLNCAAIPRALLESELFGYAPGAFTGAKRGGKMGLFEMADGGTLLLDEIGELPLDMQAKILRALQSKEFFRVGGNKTQVSDVRIIAATNRDLKQMVEENLFRADLYFRLSVMSILLPPLRERREEIPHLVRHFLDVFNRKHGRNAVLEDEALELLLRYDWPGNVRELENQMERLVILADDVITAEYLSPEHRQNSTHRLHTTNLKRTMDQVEGDILRQAAATYQSTRKMAKILGISQTSVVRKMKLHGITV